MHNPIYDFILSNSGVLITIIIAFVSVFGALISKNKHQAYANIPELISTAQALENSNPEKFKYVLDYAYGKIPAFFRFFISEQDISRAIESTFNKLKAFAKEQAKSTAIKAMVKNAEQGLVNPDTTSTQQAATIANDTTKATV